MKTLIVFPFIIVYLFLTGCTSEIEIDRFESVNSGHELDFQNDSLINKQKSIWLGTIDSNWDNPDNWKDSKLPTSDINVEISENCINCNIELAKPVKIRSLKFQNNFIGDLKLRGKKLEIDQNLETTSGTTIHTQCANLVFDKHFPANGQIDHSSNTPDASVNESSVTEGENLRVRFELSEPICDQDIVLNYSISDLQATASDYSGPTTGQIKVVQGETEAELEIATTDDNDYELEESLLIEIESIENNDANLAKNQAFGTILDNDTPPTVSVIACSPIEEGNDCTLTFQLDKLIDSNVSFDWESIDGIAVAGSDYLKKKVLNVIIPAGQLSVTQNISIINDYPMNDPGESFNVQITSAQGATIGTASASITINDASSNPLALSPSYLEVDNNGTWSFSATGGTAPYTYSIQSGIGTIDANGLYTAPATGGGPVTIQVQDSLSATTTSNIQVNETYSEMTFCSNSFDFANEGHIYDPGGSAGDYPANQGCNMWINSSNGKNIVLTFNSFVLEDGDILTLRDDNTFNLIGVYDKNNPPPASIDSLTNSIYLRFDSDATTEAAGFDISFSSLTSGSSISLDSASDPSDWEVGWGQTLFISGGKGPYSIDVISGEGTVAMRSGETHIADFQASFSAGDLTIEVTDSDGLKAQLNATVVRTPLNITSLSKTQGGGSETIYIYGQGFQPQMEIFFGPNKCLNVIVNNTGNLRCTIPVGKGTVDVSVANIHPSKSELQTSSDAFSYYPGVWTPFTSQPGGSGNDRYASAAVWTGEHFLIWGGTDGSSSYSVGTYNSGYVYSALTDSWSTMASSGMGKKSNTAHVWTGTEMIVHNGLINGNSAPHEGKAYNPYTNSWRSLATPPATNYLHGRRAIWTGEEMIVTGGSWGGYSGASYAYDPVKDSWRTIASISPRYFHDMVWTGERVIVYGGYNGSYISNGQIYNMNTNSWSSIDNTGYDTKKAGWDQSSINTILVWTGNRMVVAGGSTSGGDRNGIYNPYSNTWEAITQSPSSPSSSGRLVFTGKDIIYHRGTINSSYNIFTDEWKNLQDPAVSNGGHGAFHYNGNSIYQCYGSGKSDDFCENLNIEDLDNPIANQNVDEWRTMPTNSEPTGRNGHSMTWSGKHIILFGGEDSSGVRNDGYLYDPFKEEWIAISNTNAPSARKDHKAIWLGERLFVWGGVDNNGTPLDSGAIYHPEFDSWTTVSSTNAPSARSKFALAKTNGKVIIWGGLGSGAVSLDDGAIYDSYSNSWTTISQTNKPSGGEGVRAVFAGRNSIGVFGGDNNQGAILDVASNSWSLMSLTNAPNISKGHTLIFSKNKLVVFGGDNGSGINSELKIYDPGLDTWTTQAHGLTPRKNHTSLMLGNKLFLYGGEDNGGMLGNAQILDLNDYSHDDITSSAATEGLRSGVWIGHIGEDHFGYRNNHSGDSNSLFLWGGKSASNDFLTNGVIYKPISY